VLRRAAWLVFIVVLGSFGAASAEEQAEDQPSCAVVRVHPGSVLLGCGDKLKSLSIAMEDIRRQPGIDPSGTFSFSCPITLLCTGEPQVSGWLIERGRWAESSRDEAAVFDLFQQAPSAAQARSRTITTKTSDCGLFEASFAGLSGRGVCYRAAEGGSNAVVIAAASGEVGCILVFYADGGEIAALREKVLTILPRFRMDIDIGDAGLMKWIR
jgi:hypothetical protein